MYWAEINLLNTLVCLTGDNMHMNIDQLPFKTHWVHNFENSFIKITDKNDSFNGLQSDYLNR